ncbi:MAG: acyl-CoA reductase [Bacteroidota bacterium]
MAMMTADDRFNALVALGKQLRADTDGFLAATIGRTALHNPWFTEANQQQAISAIVDHMLAPEQLSVWWKKYALTEPVQQQRVGLVLAGNLPLVGFHDILCVFASGHQAVVKLSDKDPYLLPAVLRALRQVAPESEAYFSLVDKLKDFDAVIATGSNNTARYFEAYFGKYPHVIRRNRNGVAILTGTETADQLLALGHDIFDYFGLGCRNVAKLYVPEGYDFKPLLEALHEHRQIVNHTKYKNNFDYNYALYILNKVEYLANGCIILTENTSLQSPIACLHYEHYSSEEVLASQLSEIQEQIQLVVGPTLSEDIPTFPYGAAQQPSLFDYADGVDTMDFLLQLS